MTATPPPMMPRRVLLLLDCDHALPERGNFFRGAQGGNLAAHSLYHRLKGWASSETGRACQTSVHVFGDVAQFARSLRIPAEILHNFRHLGYTALLVDAVVLVGWYTELHARWLGRLIVSGAVVRSRLASVETAHPLAKSVAGLVAKRVKLGDFADVLPVVKDLTDPPSDVEEGEAVGAETMAAGPPPGLAIPVAERAARPPFDNVGSAEEGLTPPAATLAVRPASRSPQPPPQPVPE